MNLSTEQALQAYSQPSKAKNLNIPKQSNQLSGSILKQIESIANLTPLMQKMYGWSTDECSTMIEGYKQQLMLMFMYPNLPMPPIDQVDEVWHTHILSGSYKNDLASVFPQELHHNALFGCESKEEFNNFLNAGLIAQVLHRKHFGENAIAVSCKISEIANTPKQSSTPVSIAGFTNIQAVKVVSMATLQKLDMSRIILRIQKLLGWSNEQAKSVKFDYFNFIQKISQNPSIVHECSDPAISMLWKNHVLDTQKYAELTALLGMELTHSFSDHCNWGDNISAVNLDNYNSESHLFPETLSKQQLTSIYVTDCGGCCGPVSCQ